jgi:subtilase family serine protease
MFFNFAQRLWQPKSLRRSNRRLRITRLSLEYLEDLLVLSTSFEPWQIEQAYGFNQISFNNGTIHGDGTGQTIAIVNPHNDPNIIQDLDAFDQRYGLTSTNSPNLYQEYGTASSFLSVIQYASNGGTVAPASTVEGEEVSVAVEWAHTIAPAAKIVLVEAQSNSASDFVSAAKYAASLPGVSVVSMSIGGSSSGESNFDSHMNHNGVTFVASAGDNGEFGYPAASPNVLAVGGTSLTEDASGNYVGETVWNDSSQGGSESAWVTSGGADVLTNPYPSSWGESGGGPNPYSSCKLGPDVSFDADTSTGYYVFDSYDPDGSSQSEYVPGQHGLLSGIAGTSAGAPQWAALIAIADQGRTLEGQGSLSSSQTLSMIYNSNMESYDFHHNIPGNITYSLNGTQYSYSGQSVYGQGTPIANVLVADLVYGTAPGTPISWGKRGSPAKEST